MHIKIIDDAIESHQVSFYVDWVLCAMIEWANEIDTRLG